jgi:7-cyano-7-deazaguanine synthase
MNRPLKATVLMSGGIDSAACAHHFLSQDLAVAGLFVDYGQAAAQQEGVAATAMAGHLGISLSRLKLTGAPPFGPGELLGRNSFLIFAALFVTGRGPGILSLGLHAGTPYYDCSEAFVASVGKLVAEHTDGSVSLATPFINWSKSDVYDYFVAANLPLRATYSCEAGTQPTCGVCASCRDREALGC